ncbi:MAG: peptide ABC transporter substrate-binding protein [Rhodocyclaceae bacterium]|nr:peptide ABC transporter substrate-binding protein [Rhodocyclaceae bacterium]MBL0074684.1 peptide ABC transporter substrate-binding protein [Rhodocyclaceae bacterium]MBP6109102.1 peptide ABC transporter substrate-binding protein [Rhodocyclaceae bacterium]MBP6278825.1 peptide ABC transporter substrate-binding protein [Rhodocyclaceae bacterium]
MRYLFTISVAALALTFNCQAAEVPPGTKLHATQHIVIGNGAEPATLDPGRVQGRPESNLTVELFEGLVSQDANGKVIGGVAEKWESKEGGKVWLFTLRKNAKWSDGSPVTAGDFEYGFKRMVDPKFASDYSWYLGKASNVINGTAIVEGKKPPSELGVKALNDTTLQFTLEKPVAYLVSTLIHGSLMPIPRKVVEKFGDKWTDPANIVGNGPFKLSERVVNERIVMVRNPHYWNNAKTVIEQLTVLPINNQSAEYQRYRANAIDVTADGGVPSEQVAQIRKEVPNELTLWPQLGTYYYTFNVKVKPFDDVRVRRALSLAINRDVITQQILSTGETSAYSMTPGIADGYKAIRHDWEAQTQAQRDLEAKKLLADAGYGPGKPLKFPLLYNTNEQHKKIALAVASMWKRVGPVEVELVNQEWKTFLDTRNRGDYAVTRGAWIADYNEASTMIDLFHSKHGSNDGKYNNPAYDEVIDKAKITLDPAERMKLYQDAERILAQDFPAAFMYHYSNRRMIKPWVKGYGKNPQGRIQARDLYIIAH